MEMNKQILAVSGYGLRQNEGEEDRIILGRADDWVMRKLEDDRRRKDNEELKETAGKVE